jgi:uncharacterized protein YgbK (DUF1537 family)
MLSPRLAIIADDLTGALDAAGPFAVGGLRVAVATRPDAWAALLAGGDAVVAVSTRSRGIGAAEARARVAAAAAAVPPGAQVMKKIDSRMKGNIAAELASFAGNTLLMLPAIPEFGRIVRGGAVTGFGVDAPVPVAEALGTEAARACIPDTATDEDIVAALATAGDAVLVGARGLAQALARRMGLADAARRPPLAAPVCFAVGSMDPITLAQVDALRAAFPEAEFLAAPSGRLPERGDAPLGAITLLQATAGAASPPDLVAQAFAQGAAAVLRRAATVVMTGGATAEAMLDALGVDRLELMGEALPGMPCCRAGGQILVTKSGGFGAPDAFVRLVRAATRAEIA